MTSHPNVDRLAGEVRAELARHRISWRELARRTDQSPSALRRRLRGEVEFRTGELTKIAEVLGVPVAALFAGRQKLGTEALDVPIASLVESSDAAAASSEAAAS